MVFESTAISLLAIWQAKQYLNYKSLLKFWSVFLPNSFDLMTDFTNAFSFFENFVLTDSMN